MKELTITAWCDICWLEDRKTPSVHTLRVSITGGTGRLGPAKEMEFCTEHGADITPLITAYDRSASDGETPDLAKEATYRPRTGRPAAANASVQCPICGQLYSHSSGCVTHIMRIHRPGERQYPEPLACDLCGRTDFKGAQGLASHLTGAHQVDPVARAAEPVLARARMRRERQSA